MLDLTWSAGPSYAEKTPSHQTDLKLEVPICKEIEDTRHGFDGVL